MKHAQELLDDLRHTKRYSCISEYKGWIDDVVEYLEAVVSLKGHLRSKLAAKDPTIEGQMELTLDVPPSSKANA